MVFHAEIKTIVTKSVNVVADRDVLTANVVLILATISIVEALYVMEVRVDVRQTKSVLTGNAVNRKYVMEVYAEIPVVAETYVNVTIDSAHVMRKAYVTIPMYVI